MFAPPISKAKSSPLQHSGPTGEQHGQVGVAHWQLLQRTIGNQAVLRHLAQRASATGNQTATHENSEDNAAQTAGAVANSLNLSGTPIFSSDCPDTPPLFPTRGFCAPIQAKLTVGAVDDPLEQEAEMVSEQVMHMPSSDVSVAPAPPQVGRRPALHGEEKNLQTKPAPIKAAPRETSMRGLLRSPGQPLDAAARSFFEPRFGRDFSQVRVHTGTIAEQSARALNAEAYTVGCDIVFGVGHCSSGPATEARLLGHELTHVVQQSGGDATALPERREAPMARPRISAHPVAVQRQPSKPASHASALERVGAHWIGRIRGTYSAALRSTPSKNPEDPHAGTLADLAEGEFVEVIGRKGGWLNVLATIAERQVPGYVSQELVAFDRWDLEPEAMKTGLTMRGALVVLKRAETEKKADSGFKPRDDENTKISAAIATVKGEPKYEVNETTFQVTFAKGSSRIKVTTIEDFVLFVEAVEAEYPAASAKEVVSEIRQLWFSDENWELLVDSGGITKGGKQIDIETLPDPLAWMFDMADLAPKAGGKVIATPMGDVDVGHVLAGIDARLSGGPASYPKERLKQDSNTARFKYENLKGFDRGDPTAFATFAGDLGQAYATFIFDRYEKKDSSAKLWMYISTFAKPEELTGDIQGYIGAAIARDVRASGNSPTGLTEVKASSIIRDLYLVDKSSMGATANDYLEKVTGKEGRELKEYIYSASIDFAHVWYAKLVVDNAPEAGPPGELFDDYVREFSEWADTYEMTAEPSETFSSAVDDFLAKAMRKLQ
jgi:hypothetical protein